jgi:hypothetical protein
MVAAALLLAAFSVHDQCPDQPDGCPGTAESRVQQAISHARNIDLNREWPVVRDDIVRACGLRIQPATSHCFNDFNHVDCCAMVDQNVHRTNEESRVVGMHPVNFLGSHIVSASLAGHGSGGSWCTCHLSSPADVCHRQFGARTAFKLVWCDGTCVAALVDDWGNVLSHGKPLAPDGDGDAIPLMGGAHARRRNWQVVSESHNTTWADRWRASCHRITFPSITTGVESGHGHDEL